MTDLPSATATAQRLLAEAEERRGNSPRYHAKQREFMALRCIEAMYGGAAGGGKTEALLGSALMYKNEPKYSALILRRAYPDLKMRGSIMQRAIEWLGREFWNEQDKVFRFPSGATLQFGYCDNEGDLDRYKSAQFHFIAIDEVTEWPENWYTFLFSRLRRTAGDRIPLRMRTATNPDGIGAEWVRLRFGIPLDAVVKGPIWSEDRKTVFLPARAEDNPSLDLASYEDSLAKLSGGKASSKYQQLRWGRWVRDNEGRVYAYDESLNVIDELPRGGEWHFILGLDFGIVDWNGIAVLAWRRNDSCVYVVQAYRMQGGPTAVAHEVKRLERTYKFDQIIGDVGGMGKAFDEEMAARFSIPVEAAEKHNKLGYIRLFNSELTNARVKLVRNGCADLIDEYVKLPWAPGKKKEADGFNNHAADATLYAWRAAPAYAERVPDEQPAPETREAWEAQAAREEQEHIERLQGEAESEWWQR